MALLGSLPFHFRLPSGNHFEFFLLIFLYLPLCLHIKYLYMPLLLPAFFHWLMSFVGRWGFVLFTTLSLPPPHTYTHTFDLMRVKVWFLFFILNPVYYDYIFFVVHHFVLLCANIYLIQFDSFNMCSSLIQPQTLLPLHNKPLIIFKHIISSPNFLFLEKNNSLNNLWPTTVWSGSSPRTPLVLDTFFLLSY